MAFSDFNKKGDSAPKSYPNWYFKIINLFAFLNF